MSEAGFREGAIDYIELPASDFDAVQGFPGGRRYHFTDPGGNELAVWTTD